MGLKRGNQDHKFVAHKDFYEGCESQCEMVLIENVTEYMVDEIVAQELSGEWSCKSFRIELRLFGIAAARPRCYAIAWKTSCFKLSKHFNFEDVMDCLQAKPRMSARDFFYLPHIPQQLSKSDVSQLN